jgi:DNA-binding CsgD family transcriptional regulator
MDRKTNRSGKYQSFFAELPYSNDMMAEFQTGLQETYSVEDRERLLDLRELLTKEFWRLVDENLTERQSQVLHLLAQGYTQIEVAKQLNVNQSSITKSVHGNCDYRHKRSGKEGRTVYGGSSRKLKKLSEKDPRVQGILNEMAEIHSHYMIS